MTVFFQEDQLSTVGESSLNSTAAGTPESSFFSFVSIKKNCNVLLPADVENNSNTLNINDRNFSSSALRRTGCRRVSSWQSTHFNSSIQRRNHQTAIYSHLWMTESLSSSLVFFQRRLQGDAVFVWSFSFMGRHIFFSLLSSLHTWNVFDLTVIRRRRRWTLAHGCPEDFAIVRRELCPFDEKMPMNVTVWSLEKFGDIREPRQWLIRI